MIDRVPWRDFRLSFAALQEPSAATGEKSRLLREGQLALLADLRAGRAVVRSGSRRLALPEHPLLWAGFFLSGERQVL